MSDPIVEKEPGPVQDSAPVAATPVEEKKKREYKDFGHEEQAATRTCSSPRRVILWALTVFLRCHFRCQGRHVPGKLLWFFVKFLPYKL